jgi:hypothetical protein
MARKILFISMIGFIGSVLLFDLIRSGSSTAHVQAFPLDAKSKQRILGATVQITMVRQEVQDTMCESTSESIAELSRMQTITVAEGIGTLVTLEGVILLVTHNHWPQMVGSAKPDLVRIHDAQGELLLEIDGVDFYYNTLYRDGGTLLMRVPDELANKLEPDGEVSESQSLAPGDIVHVVHHQPGSEMELGFMAAQVTAVNQDGLHSVMTLQSANGHSIEPGDSGGGIWLNGKLIGNMWMTIREERRYFGIPETTTIRVTDRSRAAGLTTNLLAESLMSSKDMYTMH